MLRVYGIREKNKRDLNIIKTKHLKAFSLKIVRMKNLHISRKFLFQIKTFSIEKLLSGSTIKSVGEICFLQLTKSDISKGELSFFG